MPLVFVLNGPNLNLLGHDEGPGESLETIEDIEALCRDRGNDLDLEIDFRQTNHEGVLVDWIQEARKLADALVINAGAYAYTSLALRDALKPLTIPCVEVRMSHETQSPFFPLLGPAVTGTVAGFGINSYAIALVAIAEQVD